VLRLAGAQHFAKERAGIVSLHRSVRLQLALDLSLAPTTRLHACLHFAVRHDKQNEKTGKNFCGGKSRVAPGSGRPRSKIRIAGARACTSARIMVEFTAPGDRLSPTCGL
jgi:hypothetical protein